MHNYMFLFVGAAIGSPYGNTFCNGRPMGAPTFSHQAFKELDKLLLEARIPFSQALPF